MKFLTDLEISYLIELKESPLNFTWQQIAEKHNKKFKENRNHDALRKSYVRYRDIASSSDFEVKSLKSAHRQKNSLRLSAKENRILLKSWEDREDILESIENAAKTISKIKKLPKLPKLSKTKSGMTLELLLSDIHIGKKTDTFNLEVAKRRLSQISETVIKEVQRASTHYNVERIILAFIGDAIESATMHGVESSKGCEFGNSRQIEECLSCLFELIVVPISSLGIPIDCVGVTGNHDRTEVERTYYRPGEENVTWIIYKAMEKFTELKGLNHVSWTIPVGPYQLMDIYGEKVLYEHYDNVKGANLRMGLETLKAKRTNQLKESISFMRGGHYHEPQEYGIGKNIVNGSLPGNDSYSDIHGFDCEASQTLNFYIKRDKKDFVKRITSFYKRMLIQLD